MLCHTPFNALPHTIRCSATHHSMLCHTTKHTPHICLASAIHVATFLDPSYHEKNKNLVTSDDRLFQLATWLVIIALTRGQYLILNMQEIAYSITVPSSREKFSNNILYLIAIPINYIKSNVVLFSVYCSNAENSKEIPNDCVTAVSST